MELYGRSYTRRQIEARTGRLEQIGGLRRFTLNEGPEAGVEQIQVRTGAGLSLHGLARRALDISLAELGGVPLSWQSPNGDVHPAYFDASGAEWLRTAVGGLLMTCGLSYVGAPGEDEGEAFGIHGRIHHTPARQLAATGRWARRRVRDGDQRRGRGNGHFREKLRLTRTNPQPTGAKSIDNQ